MTIMDTQFDNECPMAAPDPNVEYMYIPSNGSDYCCKGFTKLMKWVLLTKEKPFLEQKIEKYITKHPEQIDIQNEAGYTALMLACLHMGKFSTNHTVRILIDAGANKDMVNKTGHTALMMTCWRSNFEAAEILVRSGADYESIIDYRKSMFTINYLSGVMTKANVKFQKFMVKKILADLNPE